MKGPVRFKQGDVSKALKAASAAGHSVERFEIGPDGRIIVFIGEPEQPAESSIDNELSRILERRP
ncbi:hypothetical protein B1812_07420 [Methylocystis bryophila]|uniref:Uncharacterized protein n=1 Tax=Methylocystis bryophila TaxID=655015 RepID=A0A1W6MTP4_9HYPH|nr:hypothetical protein B1812_07420 [Methylocystis bryophila]